MKVLFYFLLIIVLISCREDEDDFNQDNTIPCIGSKLVKRQNKKIDGSFDVKFNYSYSDDKILSMTINRRDNLDTSIFQIEFIYDLNNNPTQGVFIDSSGRKDTLSSYKFKNGRMIKEISFYSNGDTSSIINYNYQGTQLIGFEEVFDPNNISEYRLEQDSRGNIVKYDLISKNGIPDTSLRFEYEYDNNPNPFYQNSSGLTEPLVHRSANNLVKEIAVVNGDTKIVKIDYEYLINGLPSKSIQNLNDGNIESYFTYGCK